MVKSFNDVLVLLLRFLQLGRELVDLLLRCTLSRDQGCCKVSGMCCKRCTECLGFEPRDQSPVPERHPLRAAQCPCHDTSEDIDQDHAVLDCLATKYIVRRPGCLAISTMERRAEMLDDCARMDITKTGFVSTNVELS